MKYYRATLEMLKSDSLVSASINSSIKVNLPNWCIVGGLIRDIVWSKLLGVSVSPRDIDLIYFDDVDTSKSADEEIESVIRAESGLPFRVKNQARMHLRNSEERYLDILDAMTKFPTTVSATSISSDLNENPVLFSIFGYESLFDPVFRITPHFLENGRQEEFFNYLDRNRLRQRWPNVSVCSKISHGNV